ncbi:hypothetical protein WS90_22405 [Burkholderia cepacia]|uniref:Uncharacterized protein n=1 Tax=Burkholderia cepacia TaxID=292 RepID=A0A103ZCY3_BURCE|nr:hypothetical protein WS90_22405 [Burkholderia cepacia]
MSNPVWVSNQQFRFIEQAAVIAPCPGKIDATVTNIRQFVIIAAWLVLGVQRLQFGHDARTGKPRRHPDKAKRIDSVGRPIIEIKLDFDLSTRREIYKPLTDLPGAELQCKHGRKRPGVQL